MRLLSLVLFSVQVKHEDSVPKYNWTSCNDVRAFSAEMFRDILIQETLAKTPQSLDNPSPKEFA